MTDPSEVQESPQAEYPRHRAPALLAVVRVIAVLGMSFFIAFGLFLMLGAWWIAGLASLLGAIPFFALMMSVEKFAATDENT